MTIHDIISNQPPPPQYANWDEKRTAVLAHVHQRPSMYIGDSETAHLGAIDEVTRLMWMARVCWRPGRCRITLSPSQYLIVGEAGPLVRSIQKMLTFGGQRVLAEKWREESRAYFQPMWKMGRDGGRKLGKGWQNRRWRYTFTGPIGPRLDCPGCHDLLARRFMWGIGTDAGMWCEAYEDGWPVGQPFLVDLPSGTGVFAAGELSAEWFPGLPFDQGDVDRLRALSQQRVKVKWSNIKSFTNGEIVVEWRDEDFMTAETFAPDGLRLLLENGGINHT